MLDEQTFTKERLTYFCHHNWWNLTTKYQTEQILWSTSGCKFVLDLRYVSLPLNSWHVTSEAPRRYFYAFLRTISNMPPEPSAFMLLAFWYGRECYMRCTTESLKKACSRLRQDAGSRYPEKAFLGGSTILYWNSACILTNETSILRQNHAENPFEYRDRLKGGP